MTAAAPADLVLVRHAPTLQRPDVPSSQWQLAPGAMELAAALGMALSRMKLVPVGGAGPAGPIDVVVSSHEGKALATARTLAHFLGVPVAMGNDLEEHRRPAARFMEEAEFKRTMRRFFERSSVLVFGSETADEARTRFQAAIAAVAAERPGKRVAVVTHGTVITLALARANGLDPFTFWQGLSLPEALVVRSSDMRIVDRIKVEDA